MAPPSDVDRTTAAPDADALATQRRAMADLYRRAGLWHDLRLDALLDDAVRDVPDRVAVIDRDRQVTYRELGTLVAAARRGLAGLGVGPGDVVTWILPNWVEATVAHHAVIGLGAISNPVIPIYRHREVGFILRQARSRVVVCPVEFRGFGHLAMVDELAAGLPDLQHIVVVGPGAASAPALRHVAWDDLLTSSPGTVGHQRASGSADDVALLLYTSGTTADPKGALHSHNTLEHENRTIIALYGLTGDDVVFMPSPLTHVTGVLYGLHLPVMLRSTVVLQDVWNADDALQLLDRHRATFVVGATPFLHGLTYHPDAAAHRLALRVFACGGADVPPQLITDATERLGCCAARVYGSTEYPTLTGGGPADRLAKRATTDGRIIAAAEARIVGDDGRPVGPGAGGELHVRGPEMFLGYLDPQVTQESFTPDGWFMTGDLASMDEDGYVSIVGRKKDIIIRGGENLSVKEIEDLLFEHPGVQEVAVVGMPDPTLVERVCAYVVPQPGAALTLQDLVDHLDTHRIARQKLPERLVIVAELPKTASGKVQKFVLRAAIRDLLAEEARQPDPTTRPDS